MYIAHYLPCDDWEGWWFERSMSWLRGTGILTMHFLVNLHICSSLFYFATTQSCYLIPYGNWEGWWF